MKTTHVLMILLVIGLLLATTHESHAQAGCPWKATPTNASGVFLGQVSISDATATEQDCVAALDPSGNVAGASAVVVNSGTAYINLPIYGDDRMTDDVDEGIGSGETFTLYLWQAATGQVLKHGNAFMCWQDSNGGPMADCGDVATMYSFRVANSSPASPVLLTPEEAATIAIGGTTADAAEDGATPFVVDWTTSADPDGDVLRYTWELALSDDFAESDVLIRAITDTATVYTTTLGEVATVLDQARVALGGSLTLWHRVVVSDGIMAVSSAVAQVTLVRGTLVANERDTVPSGVQLHANYPNPFNPSTTIAFTLGRTAEVRLRVVNLLGQEVAQVPLGRRTQGDHTHRLELDGLPSGTYVYVLDVTDQSGQVERLARHLTLAK